MKRTVCYATVLALLASLSLSAFPAPPAIAAVPGTTTTALDAATTYLQLDNDTSQSYADRWQDGDRICVIYRPPDILFPLTIDSLICKLTTYAGSTSAVTLRAQVLSVASGQPSGLLASSPSYQIEVGATAWIQRWAEIGLDQQVTIDEPQPIALAIEYLSGASGSTPSLVIDASVHIPSGNAFYQSAGAAWREHYDYTWLEPERTGYPMIRAWTSTADATIVAAQGNAMLSSGQPDTVLEVGNYVIVGDLGPGWGDLRSLVRFAEPVAPAPDLRPVDAAVRLWHYDEVTHTVPLTMEMYLATTSWAEESATWGNVGESYGDLVSVATVPGQSSTASPADHRVYMDALGPATDWFDGTTPNHGVMLIGGENWADSAKRFRSRFCSREHQRPQLIVKWSKPVVPTTTPTVTPSPSPTTSLPDWWDLFVPLITKKGS